MVQNENNVRRMDMLVGHMKEIIRYPVKSFAGESVQKTNIMDYGLYGDRSHALLDESRPGKFLTITQFPEMARYKATFSGEERMDQFPRVEITTPEGQLFEWMNDDFLHNLETKANRKLSPVSYSPAHVPLGPIEEEHILLVTDTSLESMENTWGSQLDFRRFRPNLVFSLLEKKSYLEETWFGRRLKIGSEAELEIIRPCERCMIITVDPETGERDPSLLKTVVKERDNQFGVYASVVKTGTIHAGDEIYLL